MLSIKNNISQLRRAQGLSIRAAAARCKLPPSTYSQLERNPDRSSFCLVVRVIEELGGRVDIEWNYPRASLEVGPMPVVWKEEP